KSSNILHKSNNISLISILSEQHSNVVTNIKSALNNTVNVSDWMTKEDVAQTMEKVKNVNASIGSPPDIWNITKENETFIYIHELDEKKYFENNLICAESAVLNNLRQLFDEDPHK
ncbi:hypothetical protein FGIG_11805, partial [Fasciola gigantica]